MQAWQAGEKARQEGLQGIQTVIVGSLILLAAVKASSFGFDPTDATAALQAAVDSGESTVVVDRQASDWIVRPLTVARSDLELILEPGVVIRAKADEFHGRNDCLLRVTDGARNVTIRGGAGSRLEMDKDAYADPSKYSFSEWRHALYIGNARQVTVRDLELSRSGGDGVYVSGPTDVTLENLVCRDNYRQGMSVISVSGLKVRNCRFIDTVGAPPQCGVDFEPNRKNNRLENILFEDCTFNNNAASGVDLHLPKLLSESAPVSITFRRCTMRGNKACGITTFVATDAGEVRGNVSFEDCTVGGNGRTALLMCNQTAKGIAFSFKNCSFDGCGGAESAFRFANTSVPEDFAGVSFAGCRVRSDAEDFCTYGGLAGTGVTDVRGTVSVTADGKTFDADLASLAKKYVPDPEIRRFAVAKVDYESLKPVDASDGKRTTVTPWLRRGFTFVQSVPGPGDYPVRFRIRSLRKGRQPQISLQLRDRAGTDLGLFKVTEENYVHVLRCLSPKGNVYRLEVQAGLGSAVQVESDLAGCGVQFDEPINLFHADNSEFFFSVPASANEVSVQVLPDEPTSAELRNPSGQAVARLDYGTNGSVLRAKRASGTDEVWSIAFPKMKEDCRVRIGAPAMPIASVDPAATMR